MSGYWEHDDECDLEHPVEKECPCGPRFVADRQGPVCPLCLDVCPEFPASQVSTNWYRAARNVCVSNDIDHSDEEMQKLLRQVRR